GTADIKRHQTRYAEQDRQRNHDGDRLRPRDTARGGRNQAEDYAELDPGGQIEHDAPPVSEERMHRLVFDLDRAEGRVAADDDGGRLYTRLRAWRNRAVLKSAEGGAALHEHAPGFGNPELDGSERSVRFDHRFAVGRRNGSAAKVDPELSEGGVEIGAFEG